MGQPLGPNIRMTPSGMELTKFLAKNLRSNVNLLLFQLQRASLKDMIWCI
jgi:hypothetical protein